MPQATRGRVLDLSDGALLIEYPDASEEAANEAATALARQLARQRLPGFLDAIPGARTLLLLFDPSTFARRWLEPLLSQSSGGPSGESVRRMSIPICYGGELGPDLDQLARERGWSSSELSRRHCESDYRVAFIGFAPGFPYLLGLPPELHAPRLATPRTRVPAGSVGIGGAYTGIYPAESPGGWRLVGSAPVRLFDPRRTPPSLLLPGDRVTFEAIDAAEHRRLWPAEDFPDRTSSAAASKPVLRVTSPGLFTSVQGGPSFGLGSSGVPAGGAMDLASLSRANAELGNPPFTAALEITLLGPRLEVCQECRICLSGGEIEAAIDGMPLPSDRARTIRAGSQLELGAIRRGARSYLAVQGGIRNGAVTMVTRRLERGDKLHPAPEIASPGSREWDRIQLPADGQAVRVVLGPQTEHFTAAGRRTFLSSSYRVSAQSDRRGVRLEGTRIELVGPADIASEGTAPGAIQVPGDGSPIVLGPDRPVTGGYAKIATVIGADLPLIGQARPGISLRFRAVSIEEAVAASRD
jgi:KipI family sensor histidine kinase inhibitor